MTDQKPQLFLSYRRADAPHFVGRLHDRLCAEFGDSSVFRDIDDVRPGTDFAAVILETLREVDVVVAVIGPNWMPTRMDPGKDYVQMEIAAAFEHKTPVIPVLVEDAALPMANALQPELIRLRGLNALRIQGDPYFRRDADRLVGAIRATVAEAASPRGPDARDAPAAAASRRFSVASGSASRPHNELADGATRAGSLITTTSLLYRRHGALFPALVLAFLAAFGALVIHHSQFWQFLGHAGNGYQFAALVATSSILLPLSTRWSAIERNGLLLGVLGGYTANQGIGLVLPFDLGNTDDVPKRSVEWFLCSATLLLGIATYLAHRKMPPVGAPRVQLPMRHRLIFIGGSLVVTALLIAWYVAQRDIVHSADIRISPPPPAGASVPLFIATASIVLCLYGASLVASAIRGTLLHQVAILSSAGICAVCSTPAIVGQKSAWPWGGLSALAAMTLTAGAARSVQILRSPISARAVLNEG